MFRLPFALFAVLLFVSAVDAGPRARRQSFQPAYQPAAQSVEVQSVEIHEVYRPTVVSPVNTVTVPAEPAVTGSGMAALATLNAQRAQRGLFAYAEDPALTASAFAVASHRARYGIQGHAANDFAFLQAGAVSNVAGCAAWQNDGVFGACEAYSSSYRYAGAATVIGVGGLAYHHLFLRP